MPPKTKHNPPKGLGVPIIGELTDKDQKIINLAREGIVKQVEPILNGIGQMVDSLSHRVEVIEVIVNGALVDVLTKRIRDKLEYPDAQPQGMVKPKEKK